MDFCSTACMGVNSACKIIVLWPIFPKIGKKYCVWWLSTRCIHVFVGILSGSAVGGGLVAINLNWVCSWCSCIPSYCWSWVARLETSPSWGGIGGSIAWVSTCWCLCLTEDFSSIDDWKLWSSCSSWLHRVVYAPPFLESKLVNIIFGACLMSMCCPLGYMLGWR